MLHSSQSSLDGYKVLSLMFHLNVASSIVTSGKRLIGTFLSMLTTLAWTIKHNITWLEPVSSRVPLEILRSCSTKGTIGFLASMGLSMVLNMLAEWLLVSEKEGCLGGNKPEDTRRLECFVTLSPFANMGFSRMSLDVAARDTA